MDGFIVTGPSSGFTYAGGVLAITDDGDYIVANTDPNTATADSIRVLPNVTGVTLTLDGVNIESNGSPLALGTGAEVTVAPTGEVANILRAGANYAGIQTTNASLTIDGTGALRATGGEGGASIGGSYGGNGGNITISGGLVYAQNGAGSTGAGIGGGNAGSGGTIHITGDAEVFAAGDFGAGIGGGNGGNSGSITIEGAANLAVNATNGEAIGGGDIGSISIGDNAVVTAKSEEQVGIGSESPGGLGTIQITGGTVKATGKTAGIGGGVGSIVINTAGSGFVSVEAIAADAAAPALKATSIAVNSVYNYWTNDAGTAAGAPKGTGAFANDEAYSYVKIAAMSYSVLAPFPTFNGSGARSATVDAPFGGFVQLEKDGVALAPVTDYTVAEGSTVITLQESYLKTLANGTYTFRAVFSDGTVDLALTVAIPAAGAAQAPATPEASPQTGDGSSLGLWVAALMASGLGLCGLLARRKRRQA